MSWWYAKVRLKEGGVRKGLLCNEQSEDDSGSRRQLDESVEIADVK